MVGQENFSRSSTLAAAGASEGSAFNRRAVAVGRYRDRACSIVSSQALKPPITFYLSGSMGSGLVKNSPLGTNSLGIL